jgi:hypothetical protein
MTDYGSPLQFGLSVTPEASDVENLSELVRLADNTGSSAPPASDVGQSGGYA